MASRNIWTRVTSQLATTPSHTGSQHPRDWVRLLVHEKSLQKTWTYVYRKKGRPGNGQEDSTHVLYIVLLGKSGEMATDFEWLSL